MFSSEAEFSDLFTEFHIEEWWLIAFEFTSLIEICVEIKQIPHS